MISRVHVGVWSYVCGSEVEGQGEKSGVTVDSKRSESSRDL